MNDPVQQQLITLRKNQILDAASLVFAEKGFHSTTTKDIARKAGVSEGTIYNYFESKTHLLLGIFERIKTTIIQEGSAPIFEDIDPHTFLGAVLFRPIAALRQDNFGLFRIVIAEIMVNPELRELYRSEILEPTLSLGESYLKAEGINPIHARIMIRAISGMMLGLIMEYIMGDDTLFTEWETVSEVLTNLILNGVKATSS
jgi:AcrR family transcriptional regulator